MRFRLSLLMFLQWAVPGALTPLLSVHLEKGLGFSRLETAECCATQAVGAVVSSLVAGQIADRWVPAEKAMSFCAAVAGLMLWLLAGLTDPVAVFVVTLVFWTATGPMLLMGTTISFAKLADPHREYGPIRLWGTVGWICMSFFVTGWLQIAPALLPARPGPQLADSFRLGGLVAFFLACYALTLPSTPPRLAAGAVRWLAPLKAGRLLRGRPFAVYCVCVLGACITFPMTTQNTPLLLSELGISSGWLATTLTLSQTSEILLLALLPVLLSRLGLRVIMGLALFAWLVALSVLALGRPTGLVVGSQLLNGFYVTGFLIAGQVYVNGLATDDMRASVQGLLSCINGMGLLAGNLLAGWLREIAGGRLPLTFAVGAVITALMLSLFLIGFRTEANLAPQDPADV